MNIEMISFWESRVTESLYHIFINNAQVGSIREGRIRFLRGACATDRERIEAEIRRAWQIWRLTS